MEKRSFIDLAGADFDPTIACIDWQYNLDASAGLWAGVLDAKWQRVAYFQSGGK